MVLSVLYLVCWGIIAGIVVTAPVGPLGILCVRRALIRGFTSGFCTGMGIATADAIYAGITGFGMSLISIYLLKYGLWFQLAAALFMLYVGYDVLTSRLHEEIHLQKRSAMNDLLSAFLLTLVNPMTIVLFTGTFGLFNLVAENYIQAGALVAGVFIGVTAWWALVAGILNIFRAHIKTKHLEAFNRVAGAAIMALSAYGFVCTIRSLMQTLPA